MTILDSKLPADLPTPPTNPLDRQIVDPFSDVDRLGISTLVAARREILPERNLLAQAELLGRITVAQERRLGELRARIDAVTKTVVRRIASGHDDPNLYAYTPWPFLTPEDVSAETARLRQMIDSRFQGPR